MQSWSDIRAWRRHTREQLLARRQALTAAERERVRERVTAHLLNVAPAWPLACVGYYWPFKGEIDLHGLMGSLIERGATAALPVVVEKNAPMIFRAWAPGAPLARGIWDIPIPADGPPVLPTVLLVPLLGFDGQGYRLGYGGGYYDRTLASLAVKPLTIGVGYADCRLDTIHPQPHDIPMDSLLTDEGWCDIGRPRSPPASSPCQMAEAPAEYMGFIDRAALVTALNELVMAERAGARGAAAMLKRGGSWDAKTLLQTVTRDEAACCAMLSRHVIALGARPSDSTGDFFLKLSAIDDPHRQMALLNRGQSWVIRKLRELLPRIQDPALARDLRDMLEVHLQNVIACDAWLATDGRDREEA